MTFFRQKEHVYSFHLQNELSGTLYSVQLELGLDL